MITIFLTLDSGFKEEGRKRRCNWVEGHWEDMIYMGILDDEWRSVNDVTTV